jgi:hypothetical protein
MLVDQFDIDRIASLGDEELTRMIKNPTEYLSPAIDFAKAELTKRGVSTPIPNVCIKCGKQYWSDDACVAALCPQCQGRKVFQDEYVAKLHPQSDPEPHKKSRHRNVSLRGMSIQIPIGCPIESSVNVTVGIVSGPATYGKRYTTTWHVHAFDAYPLLSGIVPIFSKGLRRITCPYCGAILLIVVYYSSIDAINEMSSQQRGPISKVVLYYENDPKAMYLEKGHTTIGHGLLGPAGKSCYVMRYDSRGEIVGTSAASPSQGSIRFRPRNPDCFSDEGQPFVDRALSKIDDLSNDELAILLATAPDDTIDALPPGERGANRIRSCLSNLVGRTSPLDPVPFYLPLWNLLAARFREGRGPKGLVAGLDDRSSRHSWWILISALAGNAWLLIGPFILSPTDFLKSSVLWGVLLFTIIIIPVRGLSEMRSALGPHFKEADTKKKIRHIGLVLAFLSILLWALEVVTMAPRIRW